MKALGVFLPAVGAGVDKKSQKMIVGVLVRKAGNYLRLKPIAVSDCFYTDSGKIGNLQHWTH